MMSNNIQKISLLVTSFLIITISMFLHSCQKDPCSTISCQNGGVCVNGLCNCPTGWTGPDCSRQVTPSKIRITRIDVLKFPPTTTNGGGWDPVDGPDITVKFLKGTTTLWDSPTYFSNAVQGALYTFTPSPAIELTAPKDEYVIQLWDYDTLDPNDYIGGIRFTPYFETNGFPSTYTLECSGCTTSYKLYYQYVY